MSTNYKKSPEDIVLDLINEKNLTTLKADQVSFGIPTPLVNDRSGRNTEIILTASETFSYRGSFPFFYNRVSFKDLFRGGPARIITERPVFSLGELAVQINDQLGVNLTPDDYYDAAIDYQLVNNAAWVASVTLEAKPGSLVWKDSVTIQLQTESVPLSYVFRIIALNGFTPVPRNS